MGDVMVTVATLVADPEIVDVLIGQGLAAHEPPRARLVRNRAADRTVRTHTRRSFEIPRPGDEAISAARQRTNGADLHRVAREVAVKGLVGEGEDLRAVAAIDELDEP